ncbi:TetR/AcrR family transcriptional regulator [Microbacterium arabinogalactanolyticum]|uniref:TetR/AcrR family transcriptional regulator n=1 Tax=Microbacterium arabinogalactanolyticum TaxID=69365 RepID=UPI00255427E2|nr:TetR/AcrR family transcriptional regulator [Microbacterium arabinogalactanolyticum]GLC84443.1 TetR family transcriptional regulator [Microbacterium arabinogalactanolyticum]
MTTPGTARDRAKAERTDAILSAAAELFAARGYTGVSLEDIGAAVGVSGPAVYRHFAGKQALLGALLIGVSERLVAGGQDVASAAASEQDRMRALVVFHVDFALGNAEVIRVQDRDFVYLTDESRADVRRLQRAYIELWIDSLAALVAEDRDALRLRVQACFGLLNSTPHSTSTALRARVDTARLLTAMAVSALLADS